METMEIIVCVKFSNKNPLNKDILGEKLMPECGVAIFPFLISIKIMGLSVEKYHAHTSLSYHGPSSLRKAGILVFLRWSELHPKL